LSCSRQRELAARERRTRCTDRVEPVIFAAQPPLAPWSAARLEHRLAVAAQIASETGAVMTRSLNRPDTPATRARLGEAKRLPVAAAVGSKRAPRDHRTRRSSNDCQHVLIAVCVHTNDVIHLICKHPL
jgi:hypothetical protein